jgi:hypothetical protein
MRLMLRSETFHGFMWSKLLSSWNVVVINKNNLVTGAILYYFNPWLLLLSFIHNETVVNN